MPPADHEPVALSLNLYLTHDDAERAKQGQKVGIPLHSQLPNRFASIFRTLSKFIRFVGLPGPGIAGPEVYTLWPLIDFGFAGPPSGCSGGGHIVIVSFTR